jgi:putative NADPH-quinone reductase
MPLLERIRAVAHPGERPANHPERRILVINGHPDPRPARFCAALCDAYEQGARLGGWPVRHLAVGELSLALDAPAGCADLEAAMADINWSTHLIVVFPLWLNRPPGAVRNLFEHWLGRRRPGDVPVCERSLRVVITMEMPAFAHRAMLRCGININQFLHRMLLPGFAHQQQDFIGSVESISTHERNRWLQTMRDSGNAAL